MFTESTLEQIRERVSIVELVGEHVQLRKAGAGFTGLCPFHNEKTPSFHVHPLKQIFHCFGCNKSGNVFKFLMEIDGLNFPEAVNRLAKRTGVTIVEEKEWKKKAPAPAVKDQDRLFAVNDMAARYFTYLLGRPEHKFVVDYLTGRGLTEKTIKKFRLGVSPRGWSNLGPALAKKGFTREELLAAALVKPGKDKPEDTYDVFRERLMFPICDAEGNVIGFGARVLDDNKKRKDGTPEPKYINSLESPLFAKRRILYGLHENQRGIRKRGEAVIVEGYMDVIGLSEHGVDVALASMGTALTEEHCLQLKNLTRRVVTVFDPDAAGTEAYRRSVHVLLGSGMFAKDLALPDGLDPDEFVGKHGAEAFLQLCEKAPRQVTKLLKEIAARGPLSEDETARVLGELTPILVASRSLPDRAMLWDDISLALKVSPGSLKALAEKAPQAAPKAEAKARGSLTLPPRRQTAAPTDPLGHELFAVAVRSPEAFLAWPRSEWVGAIRDEKLRGWLERLHAAGDRRGFERELEALVHHETESRLVSPASRALLGGEETPRSDASKDFQLVAERVRVTRKQLEIQALSAQLRLAQRLGDETEVLRLLNAIRELRHPQ